MPQIGTGPNRAALVADGIYSTAAAEMIERARQRCLASIFIADLLEQTQRGLGDIVDALANASWRGVDTRVILGGSRENFQIAATAVDAEAILRSEGVAVRWLLATPQRGSHAKFLVCDELSLLGSHNWSPGSFSGAQVQDSVLIDSAGMAGILQEKFEEQWRRADRGNRV